MSEQQPDTERGNILVVDDTPDNLHLLSKMLTLKGYEVRAVTSGAMALTVVQAAPPELILLDIRMPQMDGYEVCKALKANPQTCNIPVIFLSAMAEIEDKTEAFEVGGIDFITKPFRLAEVVARVETHITLRRLQQQLRMQNEQLQADRQQMEQALTVQQQETERLLQGLMPQTIATQYRDADATPTAERLDEVTLLSVDWVGLGAIAERLPPLESARLLNQVLTALAELTQQYQLECIYADGVAALIAGGVPQPRSDHAVAVVEMAIALQRRLTQEFMSQGVPLGLRMGVSSGSVTAGVIRAPKLAYTLWGTVANVACQLRLQSKANEIRVSAKTQRLLQGIYAFEAGEIVEVDSTEAIQVYNLKL